MKETAAPMMEVRTSQEMFAGVTAHAFQLLVTDDDARLDCIYVDKTGNVDEKGSVPASTVARVNMSHRALIELRDLLDRVVEEHE